MVEQLDGPQLLNFLLENRSKKPLVLIIEDADQCLLPRDGTNISAMSTLLNIGDGLLGEAMNIYMICTTNARSMELDPAICRTGRLCRLINITSHTPEKATEILRDLTGDKKAIVNKSLTLAEIYGLAFNYLKKDPKSDFKFGFSL